jgi:dTMP kinase
MFFSFDGIDGTGKTTQMQLFCDMLRDRGLDVVTCRDPGSTPLGERIRQLLLDTAEATPIGRRSEMFLYMAARAQLVDEVIRPALEANQTVVCDRYVIANIVYQGYAGGLDPAEIRAVGQVATNGLVPDCVFVLDMPPAAAQQRLNRPLDRMENQGTEYKRKLRDGFLAEAARQDNRAHVIDADRPVDVVQTEIRRIALELLSMADAGS